MPRRRESIDRHAVTELATLVNQELRDNAQVRRRYEAMEANLVRKIAAGNYRKRLANKLFLYLVDEVSKNYSKRHGYSQLFNKRTREYVASMVTKAFEKDFRSEYRKGTYDKYIPKKYKGSIAVSRLRNPRKRRQSRRRRNSASDWKLVDAKTGREIKIGSKRRSFRGRLAKVTGFHPPHHAGSTGRIYVDEDGHELSFFPGVFNAKIVKRSNNPRRRRNPSVKQGESKSLYKYGDALSEFLFSQTMHGGADEEQGEADALGWFGFLNYKDDPLVEDDNGKIHTYKAAIVVEYGDGSTDYEVFTTLEAARKKWRRVEKLYDEYYSNAE